MSLNWTREWPYWLVDTSSRADDVNLTKLPLGNLEHPLQLRPVGDICFLEDGPGRCSLGRVFVHDHLRLRTESKVCDEDIAFIVEELLGKAEVNTWRR